MKDKPVCYDAARTVPELYSGVPAFMGLPVCRAEAELAEHDIAVMGAPWEGACTFGGPSNCELFVKTVRAASLRYGAYLPEFDIDAFDTLSGCDCGDAATVNGDYVRTSAAILEKYEPILHSGAVPMVFGGDHSISPPIVRAFAKHHGGKVGILHCDAHLDNLSGYGGDPNARCSPFRRLYESDGIDPSRIVHFGIHGPRNTPDGLKAAKAAGAHVTTVDEIKEKGWGPSIQKALDIVRDGTSAFYVSVCSDVMDVAFNPEGALDPCGLSSYEFSRVLFACGEAGAKAFDYVEVYPNLAGRNVSSHLACYMAVYFLCGLAKGRKAE